MVNDFLDLSYWLFMDTSEQASASSPF
jgi:hypothetical protein